MPLHLTEVGVDGKLLELALKHNLAVYDACYLALAQMRGIAMATVYRKLQRAAESIWNGSD